MCYIIDCCSEIYIVTDFVSLLSNDLAFVSLFTYYIINFDREENSLGVKMRFYPFKLNVFLSKRWVQ